MRIEDFRLRPGRREAAELLRVVFVIGLLAASIGLAQVPVASAATPTLDQSGLGTGTASGGKNTISLSATLTTVNSNDLIVAVLVSSSSADTLAAPGWGHGGGAVTMTGPLCASSGASPNIALYYYAATGTFSQSITDTVTGGSSSSAAVLMVFGVSGYNTATPFDGVCSVATGASTAPTATVSGLTNGNDFIIAGVGSAVTPLSSSSPAVQIQNSGSTLTGLGGASEYTTGNGGGSYTLAFTPSSSAWTELTASVNDSVPTAVPFFPAGILPVLLLLPAVYILLRRRSARPYNYVGGAT